MTSVTTPLHITGLDHIVLRCADVETTLAWYSDVLGLEGDRVEEWRAGTAPFPSVRVTAETIIDLFPASIGPISADAADDGMTPPIGHLDHVCLVADRSSVEAILSDPERYGVVDAGPRYGAQGIGTSAYLTDPDGTTVEIRHY